jgi:hypothetical protein
MQGTYVLSQNGVELARSTNIITTEGKKIIASYLAGIAPSWAGAMAIGTGTTAAVVGDTQLALEFARQDVTSKAVLIGGGTAGAHRIIAKTTVPQEIAGNVYELGIYSLSTGVSSASPSKVLVGMAASGDWEVYSGGNWIASAQVPETTYYRAGVDSVTLATSAATTKYRYNLGSADFSMYGGLDKISFGAYYTVGTLTSVALKFYSDDSNYYSYTPTLATLIGGATNTYTTSSFTKSSWAATGSPSWSNITSIGVDVASAGSATAHIDLIRIDDSDNSDPNYALVSRSILVAPQTKAAGSEMDIEYFLDY